MKTILLRCWDSKQKIYEWIDGECLKKSNVDSESVTDGFIKRFLFGKKIIIYKDSSSWVLNIKKIRVPLSDVGDIEVVTFGPLVKLRIMVANKTLVFNEISILESLARGIDPTYDYLDSLEIFGCWLSSEHQKTRMKKMGRLD